MYPGCTVFFFGGSKRLIESCGFVAYPNKFMSVLDSKEDIQTLQVLLPPKKK